MRVINRSAAGGEITIAAIDDTGWRSPEVVLAIGANETAHFNSGNLEQGSAGKGLSGATGAPRQGHWRLELTSDLHIEVLAYIRASDGFLTAMHDVVERGLRGHPTPEEAQPGSAGGYPSHEYRVAIFNPGSNTNQRSVLRLINPGTEDVEVTITGIDDAGMPSASEGEQHEQQGTVRLTLPAGGARTVTAAALESEENRGVAELESGDADAGDTLPLSGELGPGTGKWQLLVSSEQPVVAMSLLMSPTGHLTNLSTAPYRAASGDNVVRQVAENTAAGEAMGDPVTVDFGTDATITHTLEGPDAESFAIDAPSGQLRTREGAVYDFEAGRGFELIVKVAGGLGGVVRIAVTVEVTDVDEPPDQPSPPEVEGVSSRSVRVSWDEPENMGPPIEDYDVAYRRPEAQEYTDAEHEGIERELEITHLRERADYEFRVRASNEEETGAWSEPTLGRARSGGGGGGGGGTVTPPPPPPPPPTGNDPPTFAEGAQANRELLENTPSNMDIGQPVRATDPDGDPVTYRLEGADAGSFNLVEETGQLRTRDGVDYNFEANSRYSVVVRADDDQGGNASIEVTVELIDEDGEAPEKPAEPVLTGRTMTSLTVTWTPPENAGPKIIDYDVGYRLLNTGAYTDWPHDGTHTVASIENLDHSTVYQVVFRARNDEGTSLLSTRMLAATLAPHSTEPVWIRDSAQEVEQGDGTGTPVTLIDRLFGENEHGGRITGTFMDSVADANHALYAQTDGGRTYRLEGLLFTGYSDFLVAGYIRHAQRYEDGIVWTANDQTSHYRPGDVGWIVENDRPFKQTAKAFAAWMNHQNALFITSLENITARGAGPSREAVYCDDFYPGGFDGRGWIPLCGELDDYIAHSGIGQRNTVFAGSIDGGYATGAIRAGGVFAPNAIYVESPDGSTSHATAVLAAYATELKFANPTWGASKLREELLRVAREQQFDYLTGATDERGSLVSETRTIRVILPAFAPGTGNRFPQFSNSATFLAAENQAAAGSVEATDTDAHDTVTGYDVVGGADAAQFEISSAGALRFKSAPDFEAPADVDGPEADSKAGDNDYIVVVQAAGGSANRQLTAQQRITVTVTDETE